MYLIAKSLRIHSHPGWSQNWTQYSPSSHIYNTSTSRGRLACYQQAGRVGQAETERKYVALAENIYVILPLPLNTNRDLMKKYLVNDFVGSQKIYWNFFLTTKKIILAFFRGTRRNLGLTWDTLAWKNRHYVKSNT